MTWSIIPNVTDFSSGRFSNKVDNEIFLAGNHVYKSTDAGETWNEVVYLQNELVEYIRLSDINDGYAVGGEGLIVKLSGSIVPVELVNFSAIYCENKICLSWVTASEYNNYGFEVQRSFDGEKWKSIGFVPGNGTSTEMSNYNYIDSIMKRGIIYYRLKQIDYDGSYNYSRKIEAEITAPDKFVLQQNYPNPFNPATKIKYSVPFFPHISIKVFDVLGNEIKTLVNEEKPVGTYELTWNASGLPSGVYFYQIRAGNFISTKKMILLK